MSYVFLFTPQRIMALKYGILMCVMCVLVVITRGREDGPRLARHEPQHTS